MHKLLKITNRFSILAILSVSFFVCTDRLNSLCATALGANSEAVDPLKQFDYLEGMNQPDAPITCVQAVSAIQALKNNGTAHGLEDQEKTKYESNDLLTREQMASLFTRAFQLKDNDIQASYSDQEEIEVPHREDAIRLKQHFIMTDGTFEPKRMVTQREFAEGIHLALGRNSSDIGMIPLDTFFRKPEKLAPDLSPNGFYSASTDLWNGRVNIFIKKEGKKQKPIRITNERNRNIKGFAWMSNDKIVYSMDNGGDEKPHLFIIGLDGKGRRDLTPGEHTSAQLIAMPKAAPDEIIVSWNKRDRNVFDLYRIHVLTGKTTLHARAPTHVTIISWMTDRQGNVRIGYGVNKNNESLIIYRSSKNEPFQTLITTKMDEFIPICFTSNNRHIYVTSRLGRDKAAIVEYDPKTRKVIRTTYEHPDVDVDRMILSPDEKPLAVVYETHKQQIAFLDDTYKKAVGAIQKKLPGKSVSAIPIGKKGKYIVMAESDKKNIVVYTYDGQNGKLNKVYDPLPWIDERRMCDMKPIAFQARDGLKLQGYLTLPRGIEPKMLPVVVLPHGGPWSIRDHWQYRPEVQFLASRGYAVLQVNFRGSGGYGKAFEQASFKQWGKAMQDDVTDGVKWLIQEGIAHPKRIAIYGASYGGYTALAGLAFTPELYAAGVSYAGISNLFTFIQSGESKLPHVQQLYYERIGHPDQEKEKLTAASPLFHINRIRAPLFIAQGTNDPRVKQVEADQIVNALRNKGIDVPYMLKANEGHGFVNKNNQLDFYRALEKFLHLHLKKVAVLQNQLIEHY